MVPKFSTSGKSSKDRVHIAIYDNDALKPSQQVSSPIALDEGSMSAVGALLMEITFHGLAGLGDAHDSIRLGAAAPAGMRENRRAEPLSFKESVLFANRVYSWVYAQTQRLQGVSLPWTPLAETLDTDALMRQTGQEAQRLEKAKTKDLVLTMLGLRS